LRRILFSMMVLLLGAATVAMADETKASSVEIPVCKCSQAVKYIVIGEIENKTADADAPKGGLLNLAQYLAGGSVASLGQGLGNMLGTALQETGCFKIVDLDRFKKMQAQLEATGQKVKPPKIDYYISGAITSVELSKSGGQLGAGIIPVVGLVSRNKENATISLDLALIDASTLEVVKAKTFKADSSKASWGFAGLGGGGGVGGLGGWSVSKSLSLDAVSREVIIEAANYLSEELAADKIVSRPAVAKQK